MKGTQILAALGLTDTKDNKQFCSKLEKIAALIAEVKKLPWYSFEIGEIVGSAAVNDRTEVYRHSAAFPKRNGSPVDSDYGSCLRAAELINGFPTYQSLTIRYGDDDLTLDIAGEYKFDIPTGNAYHDYVLQLIGHTVNEVAPAPKQPYYYAVTLPAAATNSIKDALPSCGTDTLRPAMCGVCIDVQVGGAVQVVATNAHQLYMSAPYSCDATSRKAHQLIIPVESCKALIGKKINAPIEIRIHRQTNIKIVDGPRRDPRHKNKTITGPHDVVTNWLTFSIINTVTGETITGGTLIDARFPDYKCVIPDTQPYHIEVDRKTLLSHIAQNITAANRVTSQINFHFNGKVTIEAQDIDFAYESHTEFAHIKSNVDRFDIAFNGKLLALMLKNMTCKTVTLNLSTAARAAIILDNATTDVRLLMPLFLG